MDILVLPCGDTLKQQVRKQVSLCHRVVVLENGRSAEWSIHSTMWPHLEWHVCEQISPGCHMTTLRHDSLNA